MTETSQRAMSAMRKMIRASLDVKPGIAHEVLKGFGFTNDGDVPEAELLAVADKMRAAFGLEPAWAIAEAKLQREGFIATRDDLKKAFQFQGG